jgi:hypothetical protein
MGGPGSGGGVIIQPMEKIVSYFTMTSISSSEVRESFTPASTSSPLISRFPSGGVSWSTPPPSKGEGGSGGGLGSPQTILPLPHWGGPREDVYPSPVSTIPSLPLELPRDSSSPSLPTTLLLANSNKAAVQVVGADLEILNMDDIFLMDLLSNAFDVETTEAEQKQVQCFIKFFR